jgi:hypothetical protein
LVTTQFSKGTSDGKEFIEMLVVGRKSCTEDSGIVSTANLSNFVIYDSHGDSTYSNGNKGIASGYYRFPSTSTWDSVPFGSLITVYNDQNKNTSITYNDDSTGVATSVAGGGQVSTVQPSYIVPVSWLQLMPVRDIMPSPDSSNLPSPASLVMPPQTNIYLGSQVDSPYLNVGSSEWINSWVGPNMNGGNTGTENPGGFSSPFIKAWFQNLQINTDIKPFSVSLGNNRDTVIDGQYVTTQYQPSCYPFTITFYSQTTPNADTLLWIVKNGALNDTIYHFNDTISGGAVATLHDTLAINLHHDDTVYAYAKSPLHCITPTQQIVVIADTAVNVYPIPLPFVLHFKDSITTPYIDTSGIADSISMVTIGNKTVADTVYYRDSTIWYMTFCKGSVVQFSPISDPGSSGPSDQYKWLVRSKLTNRIDSVASTDSVFIDSSISVGRDTIYCIVTPSLHCTPKPFDTTIIVLNGLDSIAIPTITITAADISICTLGPRSVDSFFVTLTYANGNRDTTSRYNLQWIVNGAIVDLDTSKYMDGQTIDTFIDSLFTPGDSVQAILLAKKTNSCLYDTSLVPTVALRDSSNIVNLTVNPSITPQIVFGITATQNGLCEAPFIDSIKFTAGTDSLAGAGSNPKFFWYLNGVLVPNSTIQASITGDTTTYTNNGKLNYGADTIAVQFVNTDPNQCFVTTDTSALVTLDLATFNPYPPQPSVAIDTPTLCAANLPLSYTFTPTGLQNQGANPSYQWYRNGQLVSDTSFYVDNTIVNNDSISVILTSSVGCATPKTKDTFAIIHISAALTPSVTIPNTPITFCANQPPTITPNPTNGGTNPGYSWYVVGTNGSPDSLLGTNNGPYQIPTINDSTSVIVWHVYTRMGSNASCLAKDSSNNSDTVTLTINPVPNVAPIVGPSSVCQGAFITLTDASTGGNWSTTNPFNVSIQTGLLTGLNPTNGSPASIFYTYINSYSCANAVIFSVVVNPTDVPFDSLLHYNICIGGNDTIYNDSTHGNWVIATNSTATGTIVPGVDANTGRPIGLVTANSNGLLFITDTIVNDCGTTVRYDTILVGPPVLDSISGNKVICTIGGTSQLTAVGQGATSSSWTSNNPSVATVDSTGLVTAVGNGTAIITYSANDSCSILSNSPSTISVTINVGAPTNAGTISGGTNILCIGSSTTQSPFQDNVPSGFWTSDNKLIVTIDSFTGIAKGLATGLDSIRYTIGNSCGSVSVAVVISVQNSYVLPKIQGDTIVCNGETTQYTDSITGGVWGFANPNSPLATIDQQGNLTTSPLQTNNGVDTVTYSVTNTCGTKTDSLAIIIGKPLVGTLVYQNPICDSTTTVLSTVGTRGATFYLWGSFNSSIAQIVGNSDTVFGVKPGTVSLYYEIGNKCDTILSPGNTIFLTVIANPTVPLIAGSSYVCVKDTVIYADTASNGTWISSNPTIAGITGAGVITGSLPGTSTIKYLVVNANGCRDSSTQTITVDSIPVVLPITGVDSVCNGRKDTLKDATPNGIWISNTPTTTISPSGVLVSTQPGTANIEYLVVDSHGCRDSVYTTVLVNPIPTIDSIYGLPTLCVGKSFTFKDSVAGGVWSNTTVAASITATGNVTGLVTGNDTIKYTIVALGCDTTVSSPLGVTTPHVDPIIALTDTFVHKGRTIQLQDSTVPGVWSSVDSTIALVSDGMVTGENLGTDTIKYTYTDTTGCEASAYQIVTVIDPLNDIYAPNFFNPNSQNVGNRTFMILGKDMTALELKVFSPWGELLFETSDPSSTGWDGANKHGGVVPTGVYVYTARITLYNGTVMNKKGSVNLIRQ